MSSQHNSTTIKRTQDDQQYFHQFELSEQDPKLLFRFVCAEGVEICHSLIVVGPENWLIHQLWFLYIHAYTAMLVGYGIL